LGARSIVSDLLARERRPVVEAVEEGVRIAARHVPLSFDADAVASASQPDQRTLDALVHVGREAVANATKHAEPPAIEVVLSHADEWRLRVRDSGLGFDTGGATPGFGLESMKRHAHALGGSLHVTSALGVGTTVELTLP
jgi:signal transduction histidine kinase